MVQAGALIDAAPNGATSVPAKGIAETLAGLQAKFVDRKGPAGVDGIRSLQQAKAYGILCVIISKLDMNYCVRRPSLRTDGDCCSEILRNTAHLYPFCTPNAILYDGGAT